MNDQELCDPATADLGSTIWSNVAEDVFREHVVELEKCTNAVPISPQVFPLRNIDDGHEAFRRLPLSVEQQLADDFAAIAAVEEGAQSVSAVCIEQCAEHSAMVIRFAAVDAIKKHTQHFLEEIANILTRVTILSPPDTYTALCDQVFTLIVRQHHHRILGRLRSIKWQKPTYLARSHKKPLWQDFDNLIHRAGFLYNKREMTARRAVETSIRDLATIYKAFEAVSPKIEEDIALFKKLVQESYKFCTSAPARDYAHRLSTLPNFTTQIASALKCLHQIEKIAAYWRISNTLVSTSKSYSTSFTSIELAYLTSYASTPTSIAYEPWAKTTHVHAEVQLAVYYDLSKPHPRNNHSQSRPRIIGTSKHLCYLCFLFLTHHNYFIVSNTHGRLYDQWTIPDLPRYPSTTRTQYQNIIQSMDRDIVGMTRNVRDELTLARTSGTLRGKAAEAKWRVEPMTSREDLLLKEVPLEEDWLGDGIGEN